MMQKVLVGLGAFGLVQAADVTPVQKVLQMLGDMAAKGKKEKHEEEVAFAAFSQWCGDVSAEKTNLIEAAKVQMGELYAFVAKATADAEGLANSIAGLEATIGDLDSQLAAATAVRAKENKDFMAQQNDYEESIDALGRAITTLKAQDVDRRQEGSGERTEDALLQKNKNVALLQVRSLAMLSSEQKAQITNAMEGNSKQPTGRESAHAYEHQSGGITGMLETLETKFTEELRALQKDEANTKHAFNLLEQSLRDQTDGATKQKDSETVQRQKKIEAAGKASADLADTTAAHGADSKYLSDLKTECSMKSSEFENRQELRAGEIVAINKAVEILGGGAVSGNADTYLPKLVQTGAKASFLQVKSSITLKNAKFDQVLKLLKKKGSSSKALALLANKVAASTGAPFDKVTKMIEELVIKLQEEANAEAEQHGFCTTELAANKMTREDKSSKADELRSTIDSLKAEIADQTQKMVELTEAVRESDAAVREASAVRAEETAKNAQTVKDAKVAQEAVSQALAVLKEFYAKAATATDLLQQPSADAPATFSKPYTGMGGSATGVVGMIEVIQSDFVRLETETASEEATASREHQTFLDDSSEDKAVKEAEISHVTKRRSRNENNKNSAQKELNVTEEELSAAMSYFDKLKPTCMPEPMSWEERKAKREDEIASLKEALTILEQ